MDKTRVRDIASELGVANKDILQVLRNLNLAGKSHLSVLTDKEARMVKDHLTARQNKEENAGKDAIPEIIIRKRKQPAPTAVDEQSAPESIETAESAPEDDSKTKKSAPASAPAPKKTQDRHVYQAERVEPPEGKPSAEKKAPLEKQDIAAENAAASATDSSMEETHEAGPPKIGEGIDHEEADHSDLAGQQDQSLKGEAADEESKTKKKRRRKTRPEAVSGPQVKVISRPDPIEPEEKSIPQPVQGDLKSAKISFNMPLTPPIDSEEEHGPRKYRKDKRVVEFAPGLIIEEGRKSHGRRKGPESGKFHQKSKRPLPAEGQDITSHPLKAAKRKVRLEDFIRVSDMAKQMGIKAQDMIKALLNLGVIATINHPIDLDTATLVAGDFGYEVERVGFSEEKYLAPQTEDVQEDLKPRPPVVTIMGHVDHGKTSLLDSIRESNLTSREAGGITQHIGAYHVKTKRGEIVFLDTPGHAAFTAMRARGAQVTDIVVLVVAADDGVMEQTREAVNHAKAAGVPIVVAINKIDKENANPERISRELSELGLIPEDWGGETLYAKVSAKQRIGIDDLLELLALQAEVLDLKANPDKPARGHIVEAKMDKGRGPVGTVLVQEGTIRQGDIFICGNFSGRVRAMFNDQGKKVKSAGPAMPAEIQGFEGVPEAGDEFICVQDEKVARRIADARRLKLREQEMSSHAKISLETFMAANEDKKTKDLNLLLRADVQGSIEAISESLRGLSTPEVRVQVIHSGVGAITESDILLAAASGAIIIGFNVKPMAKIKSIAEQERVEIRFYNIIYNLLDELKHAMAGLMEPVIRESYLGQAEVRQTFTVPKMGAVAGCFVIDGKMLRNANVRVLRDGVVIHTGKVASLKRFKEDVREVTKGYECGMGIENFNDIKVGDILEDFEEVKNKQTIA